MFDDSKQKVKRASKHISELDLSLIEFYKAGAVGVRINKDFAGRSVLTFETKPIPSEIPSVLGDALHNLRSALDLMIYEIVTACGGIPSKSCKFPVRDTRQEVWAAVNGGDIKIAGPEICGLLVDVIKPFRDGNVDVWSLHALDITDKHHSLVPTIGIVKLTGVSGVCDNGSSFQNETYIASGGITLDVLLMPGQMRITNHGQASFGAFFPKDGPLGTMPIISTLNKLSQSVIKVIDTVEQAFLSRK